MRAVKVWHECVNKYTTLGKGKVLDVHEGSVGEDRYTFKCGLCGKVHEDAMAVRT